MIPISRKTYKIIISSLLFWSCVFGLLYTITVGTGGFFFDSEPLAVSVILWMSGLVFFSSIWVVAVRPVITLRTVGCVFAGVTAVWILMSSASLNAGLAGLLKAVSGVMSMILVCLFISYKRQSYTTYRQVSAKTINSSGIGTLAIGTAALCALLTSMTIIKVPLTCTGIYTRYDKALASPLIPFEGSEQSLEELGEKSVLDLLRDLKRDDDTTTDLQEKIAYDGSDTSEGWWGGVQSTLLQAKQSLIDETLDQRSIVTQNVCELVLSQIDEIRKTATRNVSIVVLLFVILSPLITLWFRLIGFVGWILFKILMIVGVFTTRKKLVSVSEIA